MTLDTADIGALWLTLQLAAVSTAVLLLLGTPLAYWLARTRARSAVLVEAVVALPLVLPPTVLGFYLLLALAPGGALGRLTVAVGGPSLAFSFTGLVIGSVLYSLPFVVQPVQNAFEAAGRRPLEVAATLGAAPLDRFFSIALPLARPGLVTGGILGFAHTLGEFGVVLMIGGNIPGETRVASIAIYDHVESLDFARAHGLALVLLLLSLALMLATYAVNRRRKVLAA
ncbi:MAG: molybdate ABC transporter permease subunit [Gammaproteobacteria bacterium]